MAHQQTGVSNVNYDIVSALYHTLQSAETCSKYIQDAEQEGDREVAEFFQEMQNQSRQLAERAQSLLARRVSA